jgi:hypothetical protein
MRLRYTDFVAYPASALEQVGVLIWLDLTDVADAVSFGEAVQVGHNCGGNRVRKSGSMKLRPDAGEWHSMLSRREQRLSWMLTVWLTRHHGYKRTRAL